MSKVRDESYTILKKCKIFERQCNGLREGSHYCTLPAVKIGNFITQEQCHDSPRWRVVSQERPVGEGSVVECNQCGIIWETDGLEWKKGHVKMLFRKIREAKSRLTAQRKDPASNVVERMLQECNE